MNKADLFLPWPDRSLSPNARLHWSKVARAKKSARRAAYYTVLEAGIGKIDADRITVRVSLYPPDNRRRDADNAISALKANFDGIADAIGIDDSKWHLEIAPRGPIEKNGMVKVELEWI